MPRVTDQLIPTEDARMDSQTLIISDDAHLIRCQAN